MERKIFKVLVKNESKSYSSESVLLGERKFKIVAENGNAYSHLKIYIYNQTDGNLSLIASEGDIPEYRPVAYYDNDANRLEGNAMNIHAAKEYIKKVF